MLPGNLGRAIRLANEVIDRGHIPYVPHLNFYLATLEPQAREKWVELAMAWLRKCDAIISVDAFSIGGAAEMLEARRLNKMIYMSVDDLPPVTV